MPAKACRFASCPHPAVSRGRCAIHARPDEEQRRRFGAAIYNDKRWRGRWGLRRRVLDAQPFCACGRLADTVHHVIAHRGDERLAFDIANLRSICARCHARGHAEQRSHPRGAQ